MRSALGTVEPITTYLYIFMKQKISLSIGALLIILIIGLLFFGKGSARVPEHSKLDGTSKILGSKSSDESLKKYAVNFYMENSASMDGYVNGSTEFKDVLGKMIVSAHHSCKSASLFFVNDKIYETTDNAISFIQMLSPSKIKVGNVGATDVNQIFRNILARMGKNDISVLFSDCIYSVRNVTNELDNAKNATTDAFLQAMGKNPSVATIILQFVSRFDGYYYDRNDSPMRCDSLRPFYVVIIGNRDALKKLYDTFNIASLPELKNKCLLSYESWTLNSDNACIVISDNTNARRIKAMKNFLDVEKISLERDCSTLTFGVGVDFSNMFVDDTYAADASNYTVEPEGYKVKSVVKASSSATGDFSETPRMPYVLSLEVPVNNFAPSITITLNKAIPAWVKKSNVNDDAGFVPSPTQSFAIQKMVEGIAAAYSADYSNIFKLQININKYNR